MPDILFGGDVGSFGAAAAGANLGESSVSTSISAPSPLSAPAARRLRFACLSIIVVSVALLGCEWAQPARQRPTLGAQFGGDFPCFFAAGHMWASPSRPRLYDRYAQYDWQHALVPELTPGALPYAYPPIVAFAMRPLALLSYQWAAASWAAISALLYLAGLALLYKSTPEIPRPGRQMAILLAAAFEPFIIECLHAGQLSTIAFSLFCAAIFLQRRGQSFLSGSAIGLCAYKPTLLVIVLPAMLLGRRWRMCLGAATGLVIFAGINLLIAGPRLCGAYLQMLLTYTHVTADGDGFALRKFIDLSAFIKLATHHPDAATRPICALAAAAAIFLAARRPPAFWPIVLLGTPVCNIYVGVYDSILAVPAMWLLVADRCRLGERLPPELHALLWGVFMVPWISPLLVRCTGVQLTTIILAMALAYACGVLGAIPLLRPRIETQRQPL